MAKVKICGITNLEDALLASELGADALGFNFYERSPRYIDPEKVGRIADSLPGHVEKIGVFVNASVDSIIEIAERASLDMIQLHGDESTEVVRVVRKTTNRSVIKAFRVSDAFSTDNISLYDVQAILLDAFVPGKFGGTGNTFDWEIARSIREKYVMYLAGGLRPENVVAAVRAVRPYAVDVSSGVESEIGKKDVDKMKAFIENAKSS